MKIYKQIIELKSTSQIEFMDITAKADEVVAKSGVREGQVLIYSPHTSASIIINHNEPMLVQDFMRVLYRLVPIGDRYSHDLFEIGKSNSSDGRSNGHSHCKAMLLSTSQTLPIEKGKILITEKQSIFFVEMDGSRKRDVIIQVMGI
jgi:secondary thiamine-phosphate synthase enzyme